MEKKSLKKHNFFLTKKLFNVHYKSHRVFAYLVMRIWKLSSFRVCPCMTLSDGDYTSLHNGQHLLCSPSSKNTQVFIWYRVQPDLMCIDGSPSMFVSLGKAEFGTKRFNCTFSKPFFGRAFYLTKKKFVYNNVVLFFFSEKYDFKKYDGWGNCRQKCNLCRNF